MKKIRESIRIKNIIGWSITLLFLWYLYANSSEIISSLSSIKFQYFLLVLLGQLILQAANSFVLSASLKPLGVKLKIFESFKITLVSSFVNFLTPVVGGASTKAVYLKSKHGLAYSSFASAFYANYLIMFNASFILGFIGVFLVPGAFNTNFGFILGLFLLAGILGSGLFIIFGHRLTKAILKIPFKNTLIKGIIHKIKLVDTGWGNIRINKKAIVEIGFWSFIVMLSTLLIFWAAVSSIGVKSNLGSYMIFSAFASISLLFNLTPGGLGVREALYASTYKITGISLQQVVSFSLVDRAVQVIVLGIGWILFGNKILKELDQLKSKTKIAP